MLFFVHCALTLSPAFVGGVSRRNYPGERDQDRLGSCSFGQVLALFRGPKNALERGASAQGSWGDAEQAPEVEGEVALVGETHGPGDGGDGEVGTDEQGFRALDAPADYILVRRESGSRLERAREVART